MGARVFCTTLLLALLPLLAATPLSPTPVLSARKSIVTLGPNGIVVIDPNSGQPIAQVPATDGGGNGFPDSQALIWLTFVAAVGLPLTLAAVRLGRLTCMIAMGLVATAFVWIGLVNTLDPTPDGKNGISDLLLTFICLGGFVFGALVGFPRIMRLGGVLALGAIGGAAAGIRIVLLRPGLLVPILPVNWAIVGVTTILFIVLVGKKERAGVTISGASTGTFLVGLAVDLFLQKQNGMASGLRVLFDRNSNHLADLARHPYQPAIMTIIILGSSLGLTFVFAYLQHRVFPQQFNQPTPTPRSSYADKDDPEAGLRQSGIVNSEFWRRRGMVDRMDAYQRDSINTLRSMGHKLHRAFNDRLSRTF